MLGWYLLIAISSAILLGGGTHAGFFGDVVIQLLSIPLLALSLWLAFGPDRSERSKRLLILGGCAIASVFVIQLLPAPLGVRAIGAAVTDAAGLNVGSWTWAPLSVAPQSTWAVAASLIPPAAIFVAAIQLNQTQRLTIVWAILALGALSLCIGFVQAAKGPAAGLHFYEVTNQNQAVGFFANRNHYASFLVVTLVLGAVWFGNVARKAQKSGSLNSTAVLWLAAAAAFLIAVLAGLAMAHSRAGVLLAMAALIGVLPMMRQTRSRHGSHDRRQVAAGRLSLITVLFATVFVAQFGLGGILSRFGTDPLDDLRVSLAKTTAQTALHTLPAGSGLGSFVPVYATVEQEADASENFANRAHNDLAEIALETGLICIPFLLAFFAWFLPKAYKTWRQPSVADPAQLTLQRAATLVILLLLAHSLADYPLRTAALSSIFAFFCAVLATEAAQAVEIVERKRSSASERKPLAPVAIGEKWGGDLQWPEDWQRRGD
jgi:O-antigen ligase